MIAKRIDLPLSEKSIGALKAGDSVALYGSVICARDMAHKRLFDSIKKGRRIAFPLNNSVIYYMGPSPNRNGLPIGSCGPTTSKRMDPYTPLLIKNGLKGMIGKGTRSPEVVRAMRKFGAIYFAASGGIGALLAERIVESSVLCYRDLGPEAIRKLELKGFPCIVAIDRRGRSVFGRVR